MASSVINRIMLDAASLNLEERLQLIARLAEQARQSALPMTQGRAWQEIAGQASYPLVGEDAQEWVSRSRDEDNAY